MIKKEYFKNFNFKEPYHGERIKAFNNINIPEDYINFIMDHNGGEGPVGENSYMIFWEFEELKEINEDYEVDTYLPGTFLFGGDGADELYGIDSNGEYFTVPCLIDEDDVIMLGKSMEEFVKNYDKWME